MFFPAPRDLEAIMGTAERNYKRPDLVTIKSLLRVKLRHGLSAEDIPACSVPAPYNTSALFFFKGGFSKGRVGRERVHFSLLAHQGFGDIESGPFQLTHKSGI